MTPAVEAHGAAEPVSKPGLPSSCEAVQPPPEVLMVQVKLAEPEALVVSLAVTVTEEVPAVVGVPEIRPVAELIDSPAGSPVAVKLRVCPEAESVAWICRLAAVPTVPVWLPGLVTVTVLPPGLVTMAWLASQVPAPPLPSFAQVVCIANVPWPVLRSKEPPAVPGVIQAHLSPFSSPLESVQPPGGFWSVIVSAYSWPFTMETPSRVPLLLTKFCPQEAPMSVM